MSRASTTTAVFAFFFLASATLLCAPWAGGAKGAKPKSTPPPRVPRGEDVLSPVARGLVTTRMESHAQDMTDLLWAVVFLENTEAAAIADGIVEQPRIARPTKESAPDDLNRTIPESFFVFQDQLRDDARAVSKAAKSGDDAAIAKAFGKLNETCVACHATYLD